MSATVSNHGVTFGSTAAQPQQYDISATVGSNNLTLSVQPCVLTFRNTTLNNGTPNTRTVSSTLSLVVPTGATLGTTSGIAARLALIAIDNAGTVELAVSNIAGGVNLGETTLISTTAISASATSVSAIYSTIARTSVPFRVVGFVDITEAAAGTWATAPTTVQGAGGASFVALGAASLSSSGYQGLPSGLIIQWGATGTIGGDATVTVTFPIAFPTACLCAVAQSNLMPGGTNGAAISTRGYTKTTMLVGNDTSSSTATWIAIGF